MAVLFSDSFAYYANADVTRKWTSTTGTAGGTFLLDTTNALPGLVQSMKIVGNGTAPSIKKTIPNTTTFVLGWWFYIDTMATTQANIIRFNDGATADLDLRLNTTGTFGLTRNGTAIATTTNAFSTATWYHCEFKATIASTAVGAYELRVNGSSTNWFAPTTSVQTGSTNQINSVEFFGPNNGQTYHLGGVYILDTSGSTCNTFLGMCRPYLMQPRAAGTNTAWTPNYADNFVNVSEPITDDDGTFNQSSTATQKDTFKHTGAPAGTVQFLAHNLVARQDAGAQRSVRPIIVDTGGTRNGSTVNTSASYTNIQYHWETNPRTASAWTASDLNDSAWEAGYELVS